MITNELKVKLCKLLADKIKASNYEWRVTGKYVYIGTTNNTPCILAMSFLRELMTLAPWSFTIIGKQFVSFTRATSTEANYTNKELQNFLMNPKS